MEQKKLGTLKEMTDESFANRPEQAPEAIDEYLRNIESPQLELLQAKLENPKFLEQFKIAITHTSLMVFIAAFKVTQVDVEVEFEQYVREFLFYARADDREIYEMRTFYLGNLNADEMGIASIGDEENTQFDSPEQEALVKKEVSRIKNEYNQLISGLLKEYADTKIHL